MQGFYQMLVDVAENGKGENPKEDMIRVFRNTFHNNLSPRMMYYFAKKQWEMLQGRVNTMERDIKTLQCLMGAQTELIDTLKGYQEKLQHAANIYNITFYVLSDPEYEKQFAREMTMTNCIQDAIVRSYNKDYDHCKKAIINTIWHYAPTKFHSSPDWNGILPIHEHPEANQMEDIANAYLSSLIEEYEGLVDFVKRGRAYFMGAGTISSEKESDLGFLCSVFDDAQVKVTQLKIVEECLHQNNSPATAAVTPTPTAK